ncbi:MAG: hypothetical protein WCP03_03665 [Candidatus Saccharibacteria bacterium]
MSRLEKQIPYDYSRLKEAVDIPEPILDRICESNGEPLICTIDELEEICDNNGPIYPLRRILEEDLTPQVSKDETFDALVVLTELASNSVDCGTNATFAVIPKVDGLEVAISNDFIPEIGLQNDIEPKGHTKEEIDELCDESTVAINGLSDAFQYITTHGRGGYMSKTICDKRHNFSLNTWAKDGIHMAVFKIAFKRI